MKETLLVCVCVCVCGHLHTCSSGLKKMELLVTKSSLVSTTNSSFSNVSNDKFLSKEQTFGSRVGGWVFILGWRNEGGGWRGEGVVVVGSVLVWRGVGCAAVVVSGYFLPLYMAFAGWFSCVCVCV